MTPLITVVIPCHNHASFLREAVVSVRQAGPADTEIVVVDDGSTDDTVAVASAFPGARCVSQPRGGLARARNRGLAESRGRLVVFLDADDLLLPGGLEAGLEAMSANPSAGLVTGRCRIVAADGRPLPTHEQPRIERDHYRELLRHNYIWMPAAAMFRREAIERIGGFDPSVDAAADYSAYLRLARSHPVHDHGRLVACYRQHGGNMSGNASRMLQETLTVLRRERPFVQHDPALLEAYYQGWRHWRELYGSLLVDEIRRDLRTRKWPRAARKAATLGWLHPRGLVRQAAHKAKLTLGVRNESRQPPTT